MFGFGPTELIIILIIIVLLFGIGRVSKIFGELGSGIKAFKDGLKGDEEKPSSSSIENTDEPEKKV